MALAACAGRTRSLASWCTTGRTRPSSPTSWHASSAMPCTGCLAEMAVFANRSTTTRPTRACQSASQERSRSRVCFAHLVGVTRAASRSSRRCGPSRPYKRVYRGEPLLHTRREGQPVACSALAVVFSLNPGAGISPKSGVSDASILDQTECVGECRDRRGGAGV